MAYKQSIEDLFRSSIGDAEEKPSPRTWKKVQRKLRMQRFLRFDPARFNVWYAGVLVVGTALILTFSEKNIQAPEPPPAPPPPIEEQEFKSPQAESPELHSSEQNVRDLQGSEEQENDTDLTPDNYQEESDKDVKKDTHRPDSDIEDASLREVNTPEIQKGGEEEALLPVAEFSSSLTEGCAPLEVQFMSTSRNAAAYNWSFGNGEQSGEENPMCRFSEAGSYVVRLEVSSPGGQTALSRQVITVRPSPVASFEMEERLEGTRVSGLELLNYSTGGEQWEWSFSTEEGQLTGKWNSEDFQPSISLSQIPAGAGNITLLVTGREGCTSALSKELPSDLLEDGEKIKFPTAFNGSTTGPTGGHYNPNEYRSDVFHPYFSMEPAKYHLRIFSRTGELVCESVDIYRGWDGYIMGERAAGGVYIWMAEGTWENGSTFRLKGDLTLLWNDRWP